MRNLILSDRPLDVRLPQGDESALVDLSALKITNCVGCFGCWTKTPGKCVLRDDATRVYPLIAQAENLIYVSRVVYGGYDTLMKTMLERAIPIQQAFIRLVNGESHHFQRAVKPKNAVIIAYGAGSEEEQQIFRSLIARNALNMCFERHKVLFVNAGEVESAVSQEVSQWEKS